MKIRRKWLRDLASIVFTLHYLIMAEQADEKVRKVRGLLTVDHLRVSWNKSTSPYLKAFTALMRPRFTRYSPRAVRIPRPYDSAYQESIEAWLYFDGPLSALKNHKRIVLDMPGGGFVSMTPRHHEDKLLAWAGKTGLPVLSLEYKKAPEHPYPYALDECYDAYHSLISTRGRCIGLSGDNIPRIVLTGDSAGANFATGTTLMILQGIDNASRPQISGEVLPVPEGLVLMYPALDMNIGSWMSDDQMSLIQEQRMRETNRRVIRKKSEDYYKMAKTPHPSEKELAEEDDVRRKPADPNPAGALTKGDTAAKADLIAPKPRVLKTRLAMSSMLSYFNDRILTPEMMRAMIILYIGPHTRPDFATDYLLSPLLAPEQLLAKFPKTYFITGERDPLVDDTVIFAGRIRQAKQNDFVSRKELGLVNARDEFEEDDHVEVELLPGISHGFLQFVSIFPEAWKHIFQCARWINEVFDMNEEPPAPSRTGTNESQPSASHGNGTIGERKRHHRRMPTESSGDEDNPLMMSSSRDPQPKPRSGRRGRGNRGGRGEGREMNMQSLGSEADIMARRMKGVTGSLMGGEHGGTSTP